MLPSDTLSVDLPAGRRYAIYFRPLPDVPALMQEAGLRKGRCVVVTDEHLASAYLEGVEKALQAAGWSSKAVVLPAGEETKGPRHLQDIYDAALSWGIDRKTPVVALGGGVIGDLAGFAAATLLRGLPLVQLPTSLIAQVDSAIGGKTGINHAVGKNLIGAFHHPAFVCADAAVLATLPSREWDSGLAEVVKHALIADPTFFSFLENGWDALRSRAPRTVRAMVSGAAAVKAAVVSEDEREQGRRAILNFGHTFAHAIERVAGYGRFTHGEAVALGMRAALYLSSKLHPGLPMGRAEALVQRIPVQGTLEGLSVEALFEAMHFDKKVDRGALRLVLLRSIGDAYVNANVSDAAVKAAWTYLFEHETNA